MTSPIRLAAMGGGALPTYIEDVFSTYLYTGTGAATTTINNGIDLSGKGGALFIRGRNLADDLAVWDSARGATKALFTDSTGAQIDYGSSGMTFNSTGFVDKIYGATTYNIASWSFRKQPKFFDCFTYNGTGVSGLTLNHSLGSVPGCVIIKNITNGDSWYVWHRTFSYGDYMLLESTGAKQNNGGLAISATSTQLQILSTYTTVNGSGNQYVVYMFAHNAGGFGATGTDSVISCGSFVGNGVNVNLGWEPQWVLVKNASGFDNWQIQDSMRGMTVDRNNQFSNKRLYANTSAAEADYGAVSLTSTGFITGGFGSTDTGIYIAIRRPMKTPTTGTSVFALTTDTGNGSNPRVLTTNFPVDLHLAGLVASPADNRVMIDRLRSAVSATNQTAAEVAVTNAATGFDSNVSVYQGGAASFGNLNYSGAKFIGYQLRRAPGFFDEVCYTGTSTNPNVINHNLTAVPELIICKRRDTASSWVVFFNMTGSAFQRAFIEQTAAATSWSYGAVQGLAAAPTATTFRLDDSSSINSSGGTYVAYLFASCPGVSKVGSYTGNGSTQTINCGFTGGARFVLIKRTDSTGDWYVWDTARGIVASNDPHPSLNSTAPEVTTDDTIDPGSTGFIVNQVAATNVNVTSATYIYLAIA